MVSDHDSDSYAGGFNSQHLRDTFVLVKPHELTSDLIEQLRVDLMVEEIIHLQDISSSDLSILKNPVL